MDLVEQFSLSGSEIERNQSQAAQKRMLKIFLVNGALAIAAFIHLVHWDQYAIAVIPLKAKFSLGLSDNLDLQGLSDICSARMKHDCAEETLRALATRQDDIETQIKLGHLQRKMGLWKRSADSFEGALALAEKAQAVTTSVQAEILYGLGKAHQQLGSSALAADYFERAIKAKPEVIQVTVTEDLVALLTKMGENDRAKKVVEEARKRSGSKILFAGLTP